MDKQEVSTQILAKPPDKDLAIDGCALKIQDSLSITGEKELKNGFIKQKEKQHLDIILCDSHSSQHRSENARLCHSDSDSADRTKSSKENGIADLIPEGVANLGIKEDKPTTEGVTDATHVATDVKDDSVSKPTEPCKESKEDGVEINYVGYRSEIQMPDIMKLIQKDLSEPYSIYTYRYFIHNWPNLCFLAMNEESCVGAIVCKLDYHKKISKRGYIAMLAVDQNFRKRKIGSTLVKKAIDAMIFDDADEVVLETEITNKPALQLYENLGFVRDKRLFRYYLNGVDALRLKLWLR